MEHATKPDQETIDRRHHQVDDIAYMLAHADTWITNAREFDTEVREDTPNNSFVRYSTISADGLLVAIRHGRSAQYECTLGSIFSPTISPWYHVEARTKQYSTNYVIDAEKSGLYSTAVAPLNQVESFRQRHDEDQRNRRSTRLVIPREGERHILYSGDKYVRVMGIAVMISQAERARSEGWYTDDIDAIDRFWNRELESEILTA